MIERYDDVLDAPPPFDYSWSCGYFSPLPTGHTVQQYTDTLTFPLENLDAELYNAATFTPQQNFYSHATLHRTSAPAYALTPQTGWLDQPNSQVENLTSTVLAWADGIAYQQGVKYYCGRINASWSPSLTLYKWNRPVVYERVRVDGTRKVYDLKVGDRYYLSRVISPGGSTPQMVQFDYAPGTGRVERIWDAAGDRTDFLYQIPGRPDLVSRITVQANLAASLQRSANFAYDTLGRLTAITDAAGMRSTFEYRFNSTFIQKMTTPYGDTTFTYQRPADGIRALEAIDPLGGKQRIELRLGSAETWFWDQRAMRDAPLEQTSAHIYTWALNAAGGQAVRPIRIKEKHPLESEITYTYEGRPDDHPEVAGTQSQPKTVKRTVLNATGALVDQISQYVYDGDGNVSTATDPKGRVTKYTYTVGNLATIRQAVNAAGTVFDTLAQYQTYHPAAQQPQHTIDAAGQVTDYTFDAYGRILTTSRYRNGATETTTYLYAGLGGRLSRITGPVAGATTDYGYDSVGRVNSVTNAEGYTVNYQYDPLDRRVKTTYPDGTYEQTIYSLLDAEWQRDRAGRWTHTVHNANRDVESVTDPAGRMTRFERCDGCGALEGIVDAQGNRTSFAFDPAGRLTRNIYADNTELQYAYQAETSRLLKMTDAKGQVSNYFYNVDNTLAAVTYTNALGQALTPPTPGVSYGYDTYYKRLKTMTDQFGVTEYGYHPAGVMGAGRLHFEDGPEGPNNEAANAPDTDKVIHAYDEYGRELSSAINGVAEARTYDALGRVATVTNPLGTFTYNYVSAVSARVTRVDYPNGHKAEYAYHPKLPVSGGAYLGDKDFRLAQIKNTRSQGSGGGSGYASVASRFDYDYDRAGNIASWYQSGSDPSGQTGQVWQFGYDAADQLLGAAVKTAYLYNTPPYINSTVEQQMGYNYDAAGNRVTEQSAVRQTNGSYAVTLTGAAHNALNQMTSRTGGSGVLILEGTVNEPATVTVGGNAAQVWGLGNGQYGWRGTAQVAAGVTNSVPVVARDASYTGANQTNINEHQTTRTAQVQTSGVAIPLLQYDLNGNLISETRANNTVRTFHWDAVNRLVKVVDGATTTEWKYSGRGQRMEEKVNGTVTARWRWDGMQMREMITISGATSSLRRYYGMGMQWTANTAQPATTVNYFFFGDHLGSLREMIDASGNLHKRYSYDLWGRRNQTVNTTTVPEPMVGFTGHFYHASTGLHLAFYRAYSAELGRWLSRDPAGEKGGINLYAYVENNILNMVDILGLEPNNLCCDEKMINKGMKDLQQQATQVKADLASGKLDRYPEKESSCQIDHQILIEELNVPKCWTCRKECGYSTAWSRLNSWGAWGWGEHCVVICKATLRGGQPGPEIILDITGGYTNPKKWRIDFPKNKHPDTNDHWKSGSSCPN